MRCPAAAMQGAADNRGGSSNARTGKRIRTRTSTSPSRIRTGSGPAQAIGKPEWAHDPAYATPEARQPHIFDIFAEIEKWLADKTKYEAVNILRKYEVPCAPVFDMKEIENDPDLRANGTIVEVPHKVRGSYLTIGSVMKFSDFTPKITGSPLLGEHTDEVLEAWATSLRDRQAPCGQGRRPAPAPACRQDARIAAQ